MEDQFIEQSGSVESGSSTSHDPAPTGGTGFGEGGSSTPPDGLPNEKLYEVKVNGKTLRVPLNELLNGYSRQQDYTHKTTQLSQKEKQWMERMNRYEEALNQTKAFLSDRQKLAAYLQRLSAQEGASQGGGEDDLLTRKELLEALKEERERIRKETMDEFQKTLYEAETDNLTKQYRQELSNLYGVAAEKWPQLKSYPHLYKAFQAAVQSQEPTSIDHAKQLLAEEIRSYVKAMGWQQTEGAGEPAKTPVLMEPPGGGPPPTPSGSNQPTFKKLRDPRLRAQVLSDLEAMASKG